VWVEKFGVGGDGAAIGVGSGGEVEGVLGEGEVVEDVWIILMRTGRGLFDQQCKEFEGGAVVLLFESGVGLDAERIFGGLLGGVGGAGGELSVSRDCGEE